MAEIVAMHTHQPAEAIEPLWRDVLGRRLRDLRVSRGDNLTDTADRAGISPQYLSEIERGLKEPSSEIIAAVAGALEVTLTELTTTISQDLRSSSVSNAVDRSDVLALAA